MGDINIPKNTWGFSKTIKIAHNCCNKRLLSVVHVAKYEYFFLQSTRQNLASRITQALLTIDTMYMKFTDIFE